jgi:hypothetical protein
MTFDAIAVLNQRYSPLVDLRDACELYEQADDEVVYQVEEVVRQTRELMEAITDRVLTVLKALEDTDILEGLDDEDLADDLRRDIAHLETEINCIDERQDEAGQRWKHFTEALSRLERS